MYINTQTKIFLFLFSFWKFSSVTRLAKMRLGTVTYTRDAFWLYAQQRRVLAIHVTADNQ